MPDEEGTTEDLDGAGGTGTAVADAQDEAEQTQQAGQAATQAGQAKAKQVEGATKRKLALVLIISATLIFFSGVGAWAVSFSLLGMRLFGEPSPNASSGGIHCADWSGAKAGFQDSLTQAAQKAQMSPALLAAILLDEHGNGWPDNDPNNWKGDGGDGPFQIIDSSWPGYWKQAVSEGLSSKRISEANKNSLLDSGLATAASLRVALRKYKIPFDTSEQKYIMYAGLVHNRGNTPAEAWAEGKKLLQDDSGNYSLGEVIHEPFDLNNPPTAPRNHSDRAWGTDNYAVRTWNNFQNLNQGCQATAVASGDSRSGKVVSVALSEMNSFPTSQHSNDNNKYTNFKTLPWCAAFVGWVYNEAGYTDFKQKGILGARSMAQYIQKNGTWISSANDPTPVAGWKSDHVLTIQDIKPGDVVFVYGSRRTTVNGQLKIVPGDHVALVKNVNLLNNKVITVSGNSSRDDIHEMTYDFSNILGAGRPK